MEPFVIAAFLGASCIADGCVLSAVLAAVLFEQSAVSWALAFCCAHGVLFLVGLVLAQLVGNVSPDVPEILALIGASILFWHLLHPHRAKHTTPLMQSSESGQEFCWHNVVTAFGLSGHAIVAGVSFPGMFPQLAWPGLLTSATISAIVTGVFVYLAIRSTELHVIHNIFLKARPIILYITCALLGIVWISALQDLRGHWNFVSGNEEIFYNYALGAALGMGLYFLLSKRKSHCCHRDH